MMISGRVLWGLAISVTLSLGNLCGHPVSLTRGVVEVAEGRVVIEVMIEDLVRVHQLVPDDLSSYLPEDLRLAARDHGPWLQRRFLLLDESGEALPGQLIRLNTEDVGTAPVPVEDLMKRIVRYEFRYSLSEAGPFLTIVQRFGSEDEVGPAIMDLTVRRGRQWLQRPTQLLSDQALTISLNDSVASEVAADQWEALRRQREAVAARRLGISSYSALYSFVYVTGYEVRHEVLIPLLTLEEWLPVDRADSDRLTVAEQVVAEQAMRAFFPNRIPAFVNGERVDPVLDRVQFFGVSATDLASLVPARDHSVYQCRVGLILRYDSVAPVREIDLPWTIFGENAQAVVSTILVDDEPPKRFRFWKGNDTWRWQRVGPGPQVSLSEPPIPPRLNIWSVPLLSACCGGMALALCLLSLRKQFRFGRWPLVGGGGLALLAFVLWPWGRVLVVRDDLESVIDGPVSGRAAAEYVLGSIYQAFEVPSENAAYDRLRVAVEGDLLEPLYLDLRRDLTFREQGGAVARIADLELVDFGVKSLASDHEGCLIIGCDVAWEVRGSVEHWGHLHQRRHGYQAGLQLRGTASGWRLTALEMTEELRHPVETSIREK